MVIIARSRNDNGCWTSRRQCGLNRLLGESFGSALPVSLLPDRSFAGLFGSECELQAESRMCGAIGPEATPRRLRGA